MKRTQIYLDEKHARELARRAAVRGITTSKAIREAIDVYLADPDDERNRLAQFRTALEAAFGVAPYLPDGAAYVDGLRSADLEREGELEGRRSR